MNKQKSRASRAVRSMTAAALTLSLLQPVAHAAEKQPSSPIVSKPGGSTEPARGDGFTASNRALSELTNRFWQIYGINTYSPDDMYGKVYGDNAAWTEWDAMKFAWYGAGDYQQHVKNYLRRGVKINGYNAAGTQADGYVWSWAAQEAWPNGDLHFDQIPRYINALHEIYAWSKDQAYLEGMLPKAERVMSYLLDVMKGGEGVAVLPGTANRGMPDSDPSTYMDQIKSGHQDAWINADFYSALQHMAELEAAAGDAAKGNFYKQLAAAFPAKYEAAFWSDTAKRYGGWRDAEGKLHDYGYSYVNLEALARGLGDEEKAQRIFAWLSSPASPTVAGAHTGSTDPYQYDFAARANTLPIDLGYWDGWSDPPAPEGKKKYGSIIQDGGSALWFAYYDMMARLRYQDADAAMERYEGMLVRMGQDSHALTYNPSKGRYYNDFNEDLVEVGTNDPFPESGIAVLPFMEGFLGISANGSGMSVKPNMPSGLEFGEVRNIDYAGKNLSVSVTRAAIANRQEQYDASVKLGSGDTASQSFVATAAFNEIAVYVEPSNGAASANGVLQVEKRVKGKWQRIAASVVGPVKAAGWTRLALPEQAKGAEYRVVLQGGAGGLSWYLKQAASVTATGGAQYSGSKASAGGSFVYRASLAAQRPVSVQNAAGVGEKGKADNVRAFRSDKPFDRIGIQAELPADGRRELVATLYKKIGGSWYAKSTQTYRSAKSEAGAQQSEWMLGFAPQQPGEYKIEIAGFKSPAIRKLDVYRAEYRVKIPELGVDAAVLSGDAYTVKNVTPDPQEPEAPLWIPEQLKPGSTLGQSFTASAAFDTLVLNTPTWTNADSSYTFTLRKDGPSGETLYQTRVVNAKDGENTIAVSVREPGVYYAEIGEPDKSVGWWTVDDVTPGGIAYADGVPLPDEDRVMEIKTTSL